MRLLLSILLLSLVCGCAATCKEPMKVVKGVCCIDSNQNNVCDNDETNATNIDCEPPYILYNLTCCQDTNGNNICDNLEAVKEVPIAAIVTNRPSTTTTTQIEIQAAETTTSTTTSTTSSTTTSTTDKWAPPTTMPVCYDTDGGENPGTNGMVSGLERLPPHERVNMTDRCKTQFILVEYRCVGDYVLSRDTLCGSFETCSGGRCCLPKDSRCSSQSDCCSGECVRKQMVGLCY